MVLAYNSSVSQRINHVSNKKVLTNMSAASSTPVETSPPPYSPLGVKANMPQQEGNVVNPPPTQTASPAQVTPSAPQIQQQVAPKIEAAKGKLLPLPDNWESICKQKFTSLQKFYNGFAGKVGCNPYFYWTLKVKPLLDLFNQRDKLFIFEASNTEGKTVQITKEQWQQNIYNAIFALEEKEGYAMHDEAAFEAEQTRRDTVKDDLLRGRRQTIIQ